jgi:hypothetical protein
MESRIPVPTDNIYKFYALFGLLLVISSLLGAVYSTKSTNEAVYELVKEYYSIVNPESEGSIVLQDIIKKQLDVATKDKKFFQSSLGVIIAIGIFMSYYGFNNWHKKVQPLQDRLTELQIIRLERELGLEGNTKAANDK